MSTKLAELCGTRFWARTLTSDEVPALQGLLERCTEYPELVLGYPPGPAEAQSVFYAGPEDGRNPENKMLLGIRAQGDEELAGVLDAFYDYPERGVWYIGLLLLAPSTRGSGIGREIVDALADAASRSGAKELQLNVVEQNRAGHRFWNSCGFIEVRRWRQHLGLLDSTFIRMRRSLI